MSRTYRKTGKIPAGSNKKNHKKEEKRKIRQANKKLVTVDPDVMTFVKELKTIYYRYYW